MNENIKHLLQDIKEFLETLNLNERQQYEILILKERIEEYQTNN